MNRKKIVWALVLIMLASCLPVQPINPVRPTTTFIFSEWDYGLSDGIGRISIQENSTGSWVEIDDSPVYYSDSSVVEVPANINTSLRLQPKAYIFPSLYGLLDYDDAKAIMRLNVTVTCLGETIFSKQNLTLEGTEGTEGNLWYIIYEVVLNFLIEEFTIYNVAMTYEIFSAPNIENLYHNYGYNKTEFVYHSNNYLDPDEYGREISLQGFPPPSIEIWITPKDFFNIEQVVYKLDFTDIENPDGDALIQVKYKVESSSNEFYYRIYYNDTTKTDSSIGTHQTFDWLQLTPENKTLDYLLFYSYATPASVSSGNYSLWIDEVLVSDTNPTEEWNEITDLMLYLDVQLSASAQWAYDGWFIIGGLVMIPASTFYLVYGGRKKLSSDKAFYFIIAFLVGWGLLLGGIMP